MSAEAAPSTPPPGRRQHLTVLFVDLCGSTDLGRQLEMEDYAELLARVRALWLAAAEAHQGMVLRTQGDGAVIIFGHPQASELDGLHAADTAFHIHQGLAKLSLQGLPLAAPPQARCGLHAGVMHVSPGDLARGYLDLVGNVADTAAKLEQAAQPGQTLASRATLGPNLGLLDWRAQPGTGQPAGEGLEVVAVLGRSGLERRFDATTQRGVTPLVGRSAVLQRLQAFVTDPQGPRLATITAAAGLGKTRLLEELMRQRLPDQTLILRGSCERTLDSEVLQPFAQMLRALQQGAASRLAAAPPTDAWVDGRELQDLVARALRSGSVDVYRDLFVELCARHRVLLVLDDWQWADDASRRLLQALRSWPRGPSEPGSSNGPCLVLAAREPPDETAGAAVPVADADPDLIELRLLPLDESQTQQVVQRWLPEADPFLARRIHAYSGGVPLFIEELCHSASVDGLFQALEAQSVARRSWVANLVAARLTGLAGRAPRLAQLVRTAAVIGIEVPLALLTRASGWEVTEKDWSALAEADFLYPEPRRDASGAVQVPQLRFKHGITHEAVYENIDRADRRRLHQQVLSALQAQAAASGQAASSEQIAHHSWGAGLWPTAAQQAELAGDRATAAFAMDRARQHYRRALEAVERSSPTVMVADIAGSRVAATQFCQVSAKLGLACVFDPLSLGNDTGPFERAVELARQLNDAGTEARALYWLGYIQYALGRFREARDQVRVALAMSLQAGDAALASQIEATLGQILVGTCEYDEALSSMERALAAKRMRSQAGSRPGSSVAIGSAYTLACVGSVWADRGDFAAAHKAFDEALQLLGNSTHPVGNSVRNWVTVARIFQGDWDGAEQVAMKSVQIAESTQALLLLAVSRSTLGYARWRRDRDPAAWQLLHDAVGWMAARHGRMYTSLHFAWLCEACVDVGRIAQARQLAAHVLRRARQGEHLGEAIACRAMASVAHELGRAPAVQRWMARAQASAALRQSRREAALNEALVARWTAPLEVQPPANALGVQRAT